MAKKLIIKRAVHWAALFVLVSEIPVQVIFRQVWGIFMCLTFFAKWRKTETSGYFKILANWRKVCKLGNNTIKLRNSHTSHFQTSTGYFYMPQIFAKWRKTKTSGYFKFSPNGEKRKLRVILKFRQCLIHLGKSMRKGKPIF